MSVEHGGVPICPLISYISSSPMRYHFFQTLLGALLAPSKDLSASPPLAYFDLLKNISFFRHGVFLVAMKRHYKKVYPSVGPLVCHAFGQAFLIWPSRSNLWPCIWPFFKRIFTSLQESVCPYIRPSVGDACVENNGKSIFLAR